jgi:phage gpG-like protein
VADDFIAARNAAVGHARGIRVDTSGLRELRRDLKGMDRAVDKQLVREFRTIGRDIAQEGSALAPRKTGTLAGSLKPSVTLRGVAVGSRLEYANVAHWGGTTGRGHQPGVPWSGSVRVQPSLFLSRAVERQQNKIVDEIGDAIERAATDVGWH